MKEKLFDLRGKVAIVTGGNGGIGLGMARGLADAGAAIAVVGRNEAKSATAVADLKERGVKAIAVTADVTDKAAVAADGRARESELGRIDVLVNNAGINIRKPPHELESSEWHSVIDDQSDQRLPVLAGGLSRDEAGRRRQDHQYRLDDVDLRRQLRAGLRRQQGRHRPAHQILCLRLGGRQHPGQRHPARLVRHRPDQARPRTDRRPARRACSRARRPARWGNPDDFAGIAVFLASPASGFVTGTAIPVDGGYSIMG